MRKIDDHYDGAITDAEMARDMAEVRGEVEPMTEEEVLDQVEHKKGGSPLNDMMVRMAKRDAEKKEKERQARALSEGVCAKLGMKPATETKSADVAKDAFVKRIVEGAPAKEGPASLSEAMHEKMGNKQPAKEETPVTLSEVMKHKGGDFENYRPHVKRRPVD